MLYCILTHFTVKTESDPNRLIIDNECDPKKILK